VNRSSSRRARRAKAAIAVAVALSVAAAAGCASGSSDGVQESTTPSAASSATIGLPAPVIVDPDQTTADATVGETIVFNQPDPANTTISTDRPDVLELTQGWDDGSAVFNPAATALAPGVAVVTIEAHDGSTTQVTVTVH
jgi:hypothetical protein